MNVEQANALEAARHTKVIDGPTIQMGDGSYFDFAAPETTEMTIEDYAWGLAGTNRFRNQTRDRCGRRVLYNVAQHVVLMTRQMISDGLPPAVAYEGLMHESDEVPWGDFVGPAKVLMPPEFRETVKRSGDAIDARFGVTHDHKDLVKLYDIRMLATEKRDLMPYSDCHTWEWTRGYEPFDFRISCWSATAAAELFLHNYETLRRACEVSHG